MEKIWIKIKTFFTPYKEEELEKISVNDCKQKVSKEINTLFVDIGQHIDKRIESLLKARAAIKNKQGKQAYNGTIKELREVKSLIFGT